MKSLKLLLTACFAAVAFVGCSSFQVKNVGGINVLVLRDISDVYPVYATTFKASMDATLKTKEQILEATGKGTAETSAKQLYDNLDAINADVRTQIVAAYTKYVAALGAATSEGERARAAQAFDDTQKRVADLAAEIRKLPGRISAARVENSATGFQDLAAETAGIAKRVKQ